MQIQESLFKLFSDTSTASSKVLSDGMFLILQTPPEGFLHRKHKFWTCAHHSLKAVIEAKTGKTKKLRDYSCDWRSRLTYLMTPWGIKKILKKHQLSFRVIKAKNLTSDEKLSLLKQELTKGPLILLVGNGVTKKKMFSWRKALTHWHYVTLRGFSEKEQVFYVYDSNTQRKTEEYLMKWTLKIPYLLLLKSRSIGASKLLYNYAIAIEY